MDINKLFWAFRGILCKVTFKRYGNYCYLGKPISIRGKNRISIGNKVRIYPGLRMEVIQDGNIIINDNVSIAQNFHITSGGRVYIGKDTTISGNVFVTDMDHEYRKIGTHIMEQDMLVGETIIGDNCFIGYGAAIQAGTKLGKQCVVGTNAVVRGEFPDYCVIVGAPAKVVKQYNPLTGRWEKDERWKK